MKVYIPLFIFICSCSTSTETGGNLSATLMEVYTQNSKENLERYLNHWNDTIPANERLQSDEEIAITSIFKKFWNPYDYRQWCSNYGPEIGYDYYSKTTYFLFPTTVSYKKEQDTVYTYLSGFKPELQVPNAKILYLEDRFNTELYNFLKIDYENPDYEELKRRMEFLNSILKIDYGHWGGVIISTYPDINSVIFNNDLTEARVSFSIRYEGGEAIFRKIGSDWVLISSRLTWIT